MNTQSSLRPTRHERCAVTRTAATGIHPLALRVRASGQGLRGANLLRPLAACIVLPLGIASTAACGASSGDSGTAADRRDAGVTVDSSNAANTDSAATSTPDGSVGQDASNPDATADAAATESGADDAGVGGPLWSGLLAASRAPVSWSNVGAGPIPARTTICQTLGVAGQMPSYNQSVTAADIVSALQACAGTNQAVALSPGTYTMTTTIFGPGNGGKAPSNVTLRGAGPQQTILNWTSMSNTCLGIGLTGICVFNGDSGAAEYSANVLTWTDGFSQGTTSITLGSPPTGNSGSLSSLQVGSLLQLNQQDEPSDNGSWWTCGAVPTDTTAGCTWGGSANQWPGRSQSQTVKVTGISGSTITISPGLYAPEWNGAQNPYAVFSSDAPVTGFGLEDLQLNTQNMGDNEAMLQFEWTTDSWVQNVAFVNSSAYLAASRTHITMSSGIHNTVRDSYFYGSSPGSSAYGVDLSWGETADLVENNIFQHMATATILENGIGDVFGFNYAVDNFYVNGDGSWQQCDAYHHDSGDTYVLWEGHEGICADNDDIHGTSFGITVFRSYLSGHDPATLCPGGGTECGTLPKVQNTAAILDLAYARYENVVMNVLGDGVYANTYENIGLTGTPDACTPYSWSTLYSIGFANGNQLPFSPACAGSAFTLDNDTQTSTSLVRWGNYDTVNAGVRTDPSETASGAPVYPGLSNPSTAWSSYPSLYRSTKPSWWTFPQGDSATPWPAVGPDVSGGNIPKVGGHAFHNPAANCYLNVLGGETDGSSGPLPFDASRCY
jgi:hypothetical protein